ncbi:VOC family protein [Micromonospora sp. LOL_021]|uniref:VOC family protein n=1 Tax=Micromonospora sp. LOL_021 TaxID=3345417 RepID=UPI003A8685B7
MKTGAVEWFDIRTPDPATAKHFYAELFGWTYRDFAPLGDVLGVTIWHDDREIGLLSESAGTAGGVGTLLYVFVEDLAAAVHKAAELGAVVRQAPSMMDEESGAFAELVDPTGVPIGVWSTTL